MDKEKLSEWQKKFTEYQNQRHQYWQQAVDAGKKVMECMDDTNRLILELADILSQAVEEQQEIKQESAVMAKQLPEDLTKQLAGSMDKLENGIGKHFESWNNGWEKFVQDYAEKQQIIIANLESSQELNREKEALVGSLTQIETENQKLKNKNFKLTQALTTIQKAKDPGEEKAAILYSRYKEWNGENKEKLSNLPDDNFMGFLISCSHEERIPQIFERMKEFNWTGNEKEVSIMDEIIDLCIAFQNGQGRKLERQNVQPGDTYTGRSHYSISNSSNTAFVKRVLLQGVRENGMTWQECRAFVELRNE